MLHGWERARSVQDIKFSFLIQYNHISTQGTVYQIGLYCINTFKGTKMLHCSVLLHVSFSFVENWWNQRINLTNPLPIGCKECEITCADLVINACFVLFSRILWTLQPQVFF